MPKTKPIRRRPPLRERTDRLVAERFNAVFWVMLFALALYAVRDIRLMRAELWHLYLIKLIEVGILATVRLALQRPANWPRAVPLTVLAVSSLYAMTAGSAIVRGDVTSTPLAFTVVALASAALMPWGLTAQLLSVLAAAAALLWNLVSVTGNHSAVIGYPAVALAIAWVASLYVTFELDRNRAAIDARDSALRTSEERYRLMAENANDIIFRCTPEGRLLYVSPACRQLLGYEPDELVGRSLTELGHPEELAGAGRALNALQSARSITGSFRTRRKDDSYVWIEVTGRGVRAASDGAVQEIVAVARDVTARHDAEEALRRSERSFRALIENASDLITVVEADGTIRYQSPSGARLMGHPAEAMVGHNIFEFVHADDHEHALNGFTRRLTGVGDEQPLLIRLRHRDGSWRLVETLATALPEGSSFGPVVINSRDVTERQRVQAALRESEERFRELFENASDMVYTQDLNWNFTSINRAAERLTGYTQEEALAANARDIVAPEHIARAIEATRRKLAGEPSSAYELDLLHKDGHRLTVELHSRIIYQDGQPVGVQGIARDITARKRAEAELQRAKDAAETANRAKSEFLANVSHEIRTPMNGILGMTDLVLHTGLTVEQREYLELVKSSGDSLLALLNDLLDFSKIEAGKLELEGIPFDLRECVERTLLPLAAQARHKELTLSCRLDQGLPAHLIGDPGRLRQILVNLIGNAIKFTQPGGEITVEVAGTQPPASSLQPLVQLRFAVHDTGIGIAADKHEAIFNAFEQADGSTTRKHGGTGLGLAICKQLVSMMGGRIWVESAPGRGSTFRFTAALAAAVEATAPPNGRQAAVRNPQSAIGGPQSKRLRVLVAEDNPVNRKLIVRLLEKRGHEVLTATNGGEAVAAHAAEAVDLVLMDVQMPEMDGLEATAEIRRREQSYDRQSAIESPQSEMVNAQSTIRNTKARRVPIIAITAHAMKGDEQRCLAAGMDAYISKPVDAAKLFELIERLGNQQPGLT
ncbi:MAG: PAS domain S-box protein [Deltaproteobacteria bacterium]|nr:PAS domain S-box protein [Deltaproteobacteria bacterium]